MIGSDVDVSAEFERLKQLEPRLGSLIGQCLAMSVKPDDVKELLWARTIKPKILSLAGWHAKGHAELRTEYAYDVVYRHLVNTSGI